MSTDLMKQHSFLRSLKRISRELNNTNIQLEEVFSQYMEENMEEKEKDKYITELKKTLAASEEEKLLLVQGLVATLDKLEDIYRYSLKNESGSWAGQMELLWRNTAEDLLQQGIIRIEGGNTLFDARIHSAVLRCGYMYQSRLLRKARVIVNKNNGGFESNGQHCGY